MAINLDQEVSSKMAQVRAEFAKIHGKSVRVGIVHAYSKAFRGTRENLSALQTLAETPEFQTRYPSHRVFAVGTEIIGALPETFTEADRAAEREALIALNQEIKKRGITLFNCAIITTGNKPTTTSI